MEALIYFLLWAGVIFLMMRFGCGAHVMGRGHGQDDPKSTETRQDGLRWVPPESDRDPVCGKTVRPVQAKSSVHNGGVYYFCSRECRESFEAAPELYVGPDGKPWAKQMEVTHG